MSAPSVERPRVIRRKVIVPDTPVGVVPRERLDGLLCQLVDAHRVVAVAATAGAGKSVAVAHASRRFNRPVAWLSVDATDTAPGRLVTYLEEALARQLPSVRGIATGALTAGIPHAEAAGLLVDAAADAEVVFVLDDLERLSGSRPAWEVIGSVVRYGAPSMRLILISRRALAASVLSPALGAELARVGDADLAFTVEEARIALQGLGRSGAEAPAAVAATGGWVIGVLFDAWRSADHVVGTRGGADGLGGYLGAHILDQLDPDDREFLISTSVLQEVGVDSAVALGIDDAAGRLASLQSAPIPAQWSRSSLAMRCHSRFREYLRGLLDQRGSTAVRELRAAYGRLLAAKGFHEEAVEELLGAGALSDAYTSAKRAILGVIGRLDFVVADRWIQALSPVVPVGDVGFAEAQLMLAIARDDQQHGTHIADALAALGLRDQLVATSERAAALMAWCYMLAGRSEGAGAVVAARAGKNLKKSTMELGGSDALIALADADVDKTVAWARHGRIFNGGQCCVASKRIIVVDEIADEFLDRFQIALSELNAGDPFDESTTLPPMSSQGAADDLNEQITAAVEAGAKAIPCGEPVPTTGAFVQPTILTNITTDNPAYYQEFFGPVALFFRVKDEDEAVRLANDSRYGLGGSVFTQDVAHGVEVAKRIDTGMVSINHPTRLKADLPFGGVKISGYGNELADLGIQEFVNKKLINVVPIDAPA